MAALKSYSQLCSVAHRKACFSVCCIAKLGMGSGDKAVVISGATLYIWFFLDNFLFFFYCIVYWFLEYKDRYLRIEFRPQFFF